MTRDLRCLPGLTLLLLLGVHPAVSAHGTGHSHVCSESVNCDSGDTASCSGHQSCSRHDHWVTCDGVNDVCEPCTGYCLRHDPPVPACSGAWCDDGQGVAYCGSFKDQLEMFYCPHYCTGEAPQHGASRPAAPPWLGGIEGPP